METITSGTQTATYAYYPNSGLLNTTSFTGGTNIARSYDPQGRLQNITTTPAADTAQSYTYAYNNLNQRWRVTREDGSYWSYIYNDRGELVSGKKYWSDNAAVWGAQTEYNFDNIGNRNYAKNGGNQLGSLRQSNYTTNSLNQYSLRSVSGALDITGTANSQATVSVNNQTTVRKGDYFYKELAIDNSTAPAYPQINVVGARNNFGAGGEDAVTEAGGREFVPQAAQAFTYDFDGNLTSDGRWMYTWDGENQLVAMEAVVGVPVEAKSKLESVYDYSGRRIQKKVYGWNVPTSSYQLQSTAKLVYDGWNLMAELNASGAVVRSYVWGSDVSGTLHGSGGIGGLLLINAGGNSYQGGYDGNGNIVSLAKTSNGAVAASYEYDPFGNTLKAVGEYSAANPFRFSTKYWDTESGLMYYGRRYANPQIGRWLSRDPIAEEGGANLYVYNDNDSIYLVDPVGLQINPDDGVMGRVAEAFKFKHHLKSSPNWDFASGKMEHTFHSITLRVCNIDSRKALDKVFSDLKSFANFRPNLTTVTVNGDRGHFNLRWTEPVSKVGSAMPIVGNSIDVAFYYRDASRELFAVTTGDHPLVGVRKWWTVNVGDRTNKYVVRLQISTEAYEQVNGPLINRLGRWWPIDGGHSKQNRMWSQYLDNIAEWWKQNYSATLENKATPIIESTNLTENPFRRELPPSLQISQYYYDYNPF